MTGQSVRPIRYVVLHKPGPAWKYGVDYREQDGVNEHVQHYLKLHEQGKLELGGPFLSPDMGGMMVTTREVSQEEIEAFAVIDPAVQSGLLVYEIRPWMTAMEHDR
jgi:uncharacterized protein YciI